LQIDVFGKYLFICKRVFWGSIFSFSTLRKLGLLLTRKRECC
jgi:hypothetical protein